MEKLQVVLLFLFIFVFVVVGTYFVLQINKFMPQTESSNTKQLTTKLYENTRIDCLNQKTFCFTDADCAIQCTYNVNYSCLHGICKNDVFRSSDPSDECSPQRGILAYMQGDSAFGKYKFICKSEDPGIAISTDTNLMCSGGKIDIDYLKKFPAITDCKCEDDESMVVVPATLNKRRHVQCDKKLVGFVTY